MYEISRVRYVKTRGVETGQKIGKIIFMYLIVILYTCMYYNTKNCISFEIIWKYLRSLNGKRRRRVVRMNVSVPGHGSILGVASETFSCGIRSLV